MSESDTMFNERDRRCAAVQLMLSTDPSYDNRIIASTLQMQIRTVQRLSAQLNASEDPLGVVKRKVTSCHLTSSKSAWKSTPKCTWMCWRVWWCPGAIRWPVADPGCGSRTRRRPTSPKRPRLGFRRSITTLYPSLTGPSPPSLITAIRRVFAELLPTIVEKACSQFRICIEAVIEAEGGYIELILAQLHYQFIWIDFFNKCFKIKLSCCFL